MDTIVRHRIMRIEDFLAWECRQEGKYEFDGCEPVAMTGGTFRHALLQSNLAMAVGNRLRGTACRFVGRDFKVLTASRVRYPDGQVVCDHADEETTFTTSPVVLFEVISASSAATDHGAKVEEYRSIPSVKHYVLLEQDRALVTVHARLDAGWAVETLNGQGLLALPRLGTAIPVAELYEGVAVDLA